MTDLASAALDGPSEPGQCYRLRAPNLPQTAKVARDMVAGLLHTTGHTALAETARLLVSEIVSNVHLHTRVPRLTLEATVRTDRVLVSVRDDDPHGRPSPPGGAAGSEEEHGRGLLLVQAYAAAWGTRWHHELDGPGKSVWFELRGTRDGEAG